MENTKKFDINGRNVKITNMEVLDFREDSNMPPLTKSMINVTIDVDGVYCELLFAPSEHDMLGYELQYDLDQQEDKTVLDFLGIEFLDNELDEVIEVAQSFFDNFLKNDVANADLVPLEDIKTGFWMECHTAVNNWEFACTGDGYLTINNIENWRLICRYRLDDDLVNALFLIKVEMEDSARTQAVLDLFNF